MKTRFIGLVLLLFSPSIFASGLECKVSVNSQVVSKEIIDLAPNESKYFGDLSNYRLKVANHTGGKYEIEIFDPSWPSRSYSLGNLKSANDELRWSFWSRDILLEASCKLHK